MIESDTPGRFSDNAFDLAAGETRRITFTPKTPQRRNRTSASTTCNPAHEAGLFPMTRGATQGPGECMTDLGFQLYSARNFPPLSDVLKKLSAAGYKHVEGYGGIYGTLDEAG